MTVADRGGVAAAVIAACLWSTAGILQRQLHVSLATQFTGRSFFAFCSLALLAIWRQRRLGSPSFDERAFSQPALLVTAFTAMSSGAFVAALDRTSVPNVLFCIATGPIIAALLGARFLGQRVAARTLIASAIALLGIIAMIGAPSGGALLGDALALVATLTFASIMVVCAKYPEVPMLPALCLAQVVIFAIAAPLSDPSEVDAAALGWMFLLGAGQLALGYAFFIVAVRRLPIAEVAMISLLEIVLGPVWVWISGAESPTVATVVGGLLVICAVIVQILGTPVAEPAGRDRGLAAEPD